MLIGGVRWPLCTGALPVGSWEFMCGTGSDVCASARNEGIVHLKKIFDPLEVTAMQENRKGLEHCDKLSEERRPSISL